MRGHSEEKSEGEEKNANQTAPTLLSTKETLKPPETTPTNPSSKTVANTI
jgi:hypothetical protein